MKPCVRMGSKIGFIRFVSIFIISVFTAKLKLGHFSGHSKFFHILQAHKLNRKNRKTKQENIKLVGLTLWVFKFYTLHLFKVHTIKFSSSGFPRFSRRIRPKALHSELLTKVLSRFSSRNEFSRVGTGQVERHFFVIFSNFGKRQLLKLAKTNSLVTSVFGFRVGTSFYNFSWFFAIFLWFFAIFVVKNA